MTQSPLDEIATRLVEARRSNTQWDASLVSPPENTNDAYVVQDLVAEHLGVGISAWKASLPEGQSTPIVGPIYSDLVFKGGCELAASNFFSIGIEGEIAFRINRDLLKREQPYTRSDIIDAVAEMFPAIEIVDTRILDGYSANPRLTLADNQSNGALVYGQAVSGWQDMELVRQQAQITVNGEVKYTGESENRAGDLFTLMAGTANECAKRGKPIKAGDIITTGTYTGILFVEAGDRVELTFHKIGSVSVSFPA